LHAGCRFKRLTQQRRAPDPTNRKRIRIQRKTRQRCNKYETNGWWNFLHIGFYILSHDVTRHTGDKEVSNLWTVL
jgi:hypothetical protein